MKSAVLIILKIFLLISNSYCQTAEQRLNPCSDSTYSVQIVSDTLFNSSQRITLLILDQCAQQKFSIHLAYQTSELQKTSQIAIDRGAIAAINGSFFDMDNGGSVTYSEVEDSVISRTRQSELKWGVSESIINGAIVLNKNHTLGIETASKESFYEKSKEEHFVLVTGPLLISNSSAWKLPDLDFVNKRHPRTCLGINKESIILVCIDGRSEEAEGMNLLEAQKFLLDLGCTDAINLDGGGSTCMWIEEKGIINIPSDKTGERPVANALLIIEK